jgi:hypothetical protein
MSSPAYRMVEHFLRRKRDRDRRRLDDEREQRRLEACREDRSGRRDRSALKGRYSA